jgi:hypothetical protein
MSWLLDVQTESEMIRVIENMPLGTIGLEAVGN